MLPPRSTRIAITLLVAARLIDRLIDVVAINMNNLFKFYRCFAEKTVDIQLTYIYLFRN